jgi:tetratricopeptide (TPR) repeat protein
MFELHSKLNLAQIYYKKAAECVDDESSGMETHFNMGFIALHQQEYQQAAEHFQLALLVNNMHQ